MFIPYDLFATYLVQSASTVRIGHNLDGRLRAIAHVCTARDVELTNAEIAKSRDHELWANDRVEVTAGGTTNCHVYSDVGHVVTHLQLYWSAIDGKVGALPDIVVAAARETLRCGFA